MRGSLPRGILATCTAVVMSSLLITASGQSSKPRPRLAFGKCEAEMAKLLGEQPVTVGRGTKMRAPRRLRHVQPRYPRSDGHRPAGFAWMGEALIGADGKIQRVWTVKEIEFDPPWPEFNKSIVEAMKQWVFEPTVVGGRPVPVCMKVTTSVNWQ